eukprot:UN25078
MCGVDKFLIGGGNSIQPMLNYVEKHKPEVFEGGHDLALTVTYLCDLFWLNFAKEVSGKVKKDEFGEEDVKKYLADKFDEHEDLPDVMTNLFYSSAGYDRGQKLNIDDINKKLKTHEESFD